LSLIISILINAQNLTISDDDCPPVPWVSAELLENGDVEVIWDVPCDTCNSVIYRVSIVENFDPCAGETPQDGVLSVIGNQTDTSFIYTGFFGNVPAFAIRAEYDTCYASWTFSNVVYYDSTWYDTTFQLIVNVSLEDGNNPEGANVIVDGANCYYEALTYNEQADEDGIAFFDEVMNGTYDINVSKPGYHTAVVEDFRIWQDSTIAIELKIYYVDIDENKELNNISIFPNPATNQLNIQSEKKIEQVTLINHLGQTVLTVESNEKQLIINTSGLIAGVYIVRLKTAKNLVNKRIVIGD